MTSITVEDFISHTSSGVDEDVYFIWRGRPIHSTEDLPDYAEEEPILLHHRMRGGKGGFGSMLRAIGNQIEKTTNHDMCRDLSGRRMRDVNAEAKLKEWYSKAGERERAKIDRYLEKQRRRREALERGPLHDHKFDDPEFSRRKEKISLQLRDAVESALTKIVADAKPPQAKRTKIWIEKVDSGDEDCSDTSSGSADEDSSVGSLSSLISGMEAEEEDTDHGHSGPSTSAEPTIDQKKYTPATDEDASGEEKVVTFQIELPDPTEHTSAQIIHPTAPLVESLPEDVLTETNAANDLEIHGMEVLKQSLVSRGLKCGGTLSQRAERLFAVRGLHPSQYPTKMKAFSATSTSKYK